MAIFYNDGQVKRIFSYLRNINWFIIGGPADANEAQILKIQYPNINVLGIEPNKKMYEFQLENKFPGTLINKALWSSEGIKELIMVDETNRCGSLVNYEKGRYKESIETITLDQLNKVYGPFDNVFLWIDIEGSELECLKGAEKLLKEDKIKMLNIELVNTTEHMITDYLKKFNYRPVKRFDIRDMKNGRIISDVLFISGV